LGSVGIDDLEKFIGIGFPVNLGVFGDACGVILEAVFEDALEQRMFDRFFIRRPFAVVEVGVDEEFVEREKADFDFIRRYFPAREFFGVLGYGPKICLDVKIFVLFLVLSNLGDFDVEFVFHFRAEGYVFADLVLGVFELGPFPDADAIELNGGGGLFVGYMDSFARGGLIVEQRISHSQV